ncbi:methyltransferase domain-containing protein [Streptosporangium sp. NPDC023963]|uniref:methyltransferase domain-containing protein n=1 Tax=Streptosporangium sp. NPDC023963 TaxID=3155608 RepID=UPI0034433D99
MNNVRTPFTALDEQSADNRRFLLRHIEVAARLPTIRRVRRRALEAWDLQDPGRLLDVGSGAGEVVRDLAALVGPAGEVIGVDNSQAAVDFARERADAAVVRYDQGDALALPYPDDHFDGVRCERVLQHVIDPDAAIAEMVRVLRPGGRVCLIDTDWESMLFDGTPQLSETYRKLAPALPAATSTGRTLRRRLVTAGLADVSAEPVTVAITDYAEAAALMSVVDRAVLQGPLLNLGETAEPWLAEVDRAVADGTLLAVLTIWVVTGTKPAP